MIPYEKLTEKAKIGPPLDVDLLLIVNQLLEVYSTSLKTCLFQQFCPFIIIFLLFAAPQSCLKQPSRFIKNQIIFTKPDFYEPTKPVANLSLDSKTDSGTPNNTNLNNFKIQNKVFKKQLEIKNFENKK